MILYLWKADFMENENKNPSPKTPGLDAYHEATIPAVYCVHF